MKHLLLTILASALLGVVALLPAAPARESAEPVRLRVDLDRGVLHANTVERAIVKIGLDGVRIAPRRQRPPVNLSLVIDRSGSMSGDKIAQAREAALELVRRLGPDDIISLVAYDTRAEVLVPAQRARNTRHLEQVIRGLEPAGNTALHAGVQLGASEVRKFAGEHSLVNRVILLSDGLANVGPGRPADLARLGHSLGREGISVTTIGLGLGYNEDLMIQLARASEGSTYFVEHSNDLPRIFAAELGDVINLVARKVVIEIDFPEGVRPIAFVGREGVINGRRAELPLGSLYGNQERFALIEVEVSPFHEGAEREIARVQVNYEDADTERTHTVKASSRVKFSGSREAVLGSADRQVQSDYAANAVAADREKVVALVDAGRRDEAARLIRSRSEELRAMADTYQNAEVAKTAAAAAPAAEKVEREGLTNAERKFNLSEAAGWATGQTYRGPESAPADGR